MPEKNKEEVRVSKKTKAKTKKYNAITRRIEELTAQAARLARSLGINNTIAA